jgi:hypothetical protein
MRHASTVMVAVGALVDFSTVNATLGIIQQAIDRNLALTSSPHLDCTAHE